MQWALVVVLVIPGLYFLVFHKPPLPLNHEDVGIGNLHTVHDIIGIVLLALAGIVVWRARRTAQASPPTTAVR